MGLALGVLVALTQAALPTVATPAGPRVASAQWCGRCHAEELSQWRSSRHAVAATNALYRANHAQEPMQWCLTCHAPLGDEGEGVGCASCHVRDGAVRTARATKEGRKAHAEVEDAALAGVDGCAGCHEVNFPVGRAEPVTLSRFPMQHTVSEWRATDRRASCPDCHVKRGGHRMTGGHDLARVRKALTVTAQRLPGGELRFTLRSQHVGHALPTGDPFRALRVEVCADEACDQVLAARRLGRTIARAGKSWRVVEDLTIPPPAPGQPGEREVEFPVPRGAGFYRVVLEYAGPSTAPLVPRDEAEAEVLRGALPPG